jgi:hypothetical protein
MYVLYQNKCREARCQWRMFDVTYELFEFGSPKDWLGVALDNLAYEINQLRDDGDRRGDERAINSLADLTIAEDKL